MSKQSVRNAVSNAVSKQKNPKISTDVAEHAHRMLTDAHRIYQDLSALLVLPEFHFTGAPI